MSILSKLGFGRRKPEVSSTFKGRVDAFWEWFRLESDRIYKAVEAQDTATMQEVGFKIDELLSMAWVFGEGEGGQGYSLTLSGEGMRPGQMLAEFWKSRAPTLPGWTFYDSRQPGSVKGIELAYGDLNFAADEVWLTPVLDREAGKLDITIWHPHFSKIEEQHQFNILFIWLDEALGEYGTGHYIGVIEVSNQELRGAMNINELYDHIEELKQKGDLEEKKGDYTSYSLKEPTDRALRMDTIGGITECPDVVEAYLAAKGPAKKDPVAEVGADFLFVSLDVRNLKGDQLVDEREDIADKLRESLGQHECGRVTGGATGQLNSYIDVLIFDGDTSIQVMQETLRGVDLPYGATIHPFYRTRDATPIPI